MKSTRVSRTKTHHRARRAALLTAAVLFLFTAASGPAQAQDAEETFVRALQRFMEAEGWETAETGNLLRWLHTYRWENMTGVDPEVVGLALGALRRQQAQLSAEHTARLAFELAALVREMQTLGFERGQITRAAVNGVRAVLVNRERVRAGDDALDPGEAIKECLHEQLLLQERIRLQQQLRLRTNSDTGGGWGYTGSPGAGHPR